MIHKLKSLVVQYKFTSFYFVFSGLLMSMQQESCVATDPNNQHDIVNWEGPVSWEQALDEVWQRLSQRYVVCDTRLISKSLRKKITRDFMQEQMRLMHWQLTKGRESCLIKEAKEELRAMYEQYCYSVNMLKATLTVHGDSILTLQFGRALRVQLFDSMLEYLGKVSSTFIQVRCLLYSIILYLLLGRVAKLIDLLDRHEPEFIQCLGLRLQGYFVKHDYAQQVGDWLEEQLCILVDRYSDSKISREEVYTTKKDLCNTLVQKLQMYVYYNNYDRYYYSSSCEPLSALTDLKWFCSAEEYLCVISGFSFAERTIRAGRTGRAAGRRTRSF